VALGSLPALDDKGRPTFAYGRTIHEHCPRRAHFDAGRFVQQFGDEGHRQGWCLYKTGCKGRPPTPACSTLQFGEVVDAWPIGLGHPCFGCTEQSLAFRVPLHDTVMIERPTPPDTYPPIHAEQGNVARSRRASPASRWRALGPATASPRAGRRALRGPGGEAMNADRRRALRVLAGTGAAGRDRGRRAPAHAAARRSRPRPRRWACCTTPRSASGARPA